jgi:hypothetical protein
MNHPSSYQHLPLRQSHHFHLHHHHHRRRRRRRRRHHHYHNLHHFHLHLLCLFFTEPNKSLTNTMTYDGKKMEKIETELKIDLYY